uniref:Cytochrome b5 heme-binding domain-containing protein n=1 Tax=Picea sitchensis TaxID=3332 RepID=A9NRG1_PICSI|nr:unknown [Picea sitchensis]
MGLWGALMEAIPAYTGLTPVTFFTLVAVLVGVYNLVSGMFAGPPQHVSREAVAMEPLPPPVQLGEVTEEELKAYDGSDPKKPLLMAIKGQIYDVTQSRMFYGPGGPYALFAGKDASRALAKMSFEEKDLTGDIEGLGPFELDALQDWEYKFMGKYVKVGQIKKTAPKEEVTGGTSNDGPEVENSLTEENATEGAEQAEAAVEPKENGVETTVDDAELEDGSDSKISREYPEEINESLEDALEVKKAKDVLHEANHTAEVAQE